MASMTQVNPGRQSRAVKPPHQPSYERDLRLVQLLVIIGTLGMTLLATVIFAAVAGRGALEAYMLPAAFLLVIFNLTTLYMNLRIFVGRSMSEGEMRKSADKTKIAPERVGWMIRSVLRIMAFLALLGSGVLLLAGSALLGGIFKLGATFGFPSVLLVIGVIVALVLLFIFWPPAKNGLRFLIEQTDRDALFQYNATHNNC